MNVNSEGLMLARARLEEVQVQDGPHGQYARLRFRTTEGLIVGALYSTIKGPMYGKVLNAVGVTDITQLPTTDVAILYRVNAKGYRELAHIVTGLVP